MNLFSLITFIGIVLTQTDGPVTDEVPDAELHPNDIESVFAGIKSTYERVHSGAVIVHLAKTRTQRGDVQKTGASIRLVFDRTNERWRQEYTSNATQPNPRETIVIKNGGIVTLWKSNGRHSSIVSESTLHKEDARIDPLIFGFLSHEGIEARSSYRLFQSRFKGWIDNGQVRAYEKDGFCQVLADQAVGKHVILRHTLIDRTNGFTPVETVVTINKKVSSKVKVRWEKRFGQLVPIEIESYRDYTASEERLHFALDWQSVNNPIPSVEFDHRSHLPVGTIIVDVTRSKNFRPPIVERIGDLPAREIAPSLVPRSWRKTVFVNAIVVLALIVSGFWLNAKRNSHTSRPKRL